MTRKQRRAAKHAAGLGKGRPTPKRPGKHPDPKVNRTMSRAELAAVQAGKRSAAARIAGGAAGGLEGLLGGLRGARSAEQQAIENLRREALGLPSPARGRLGLGRGHRGI